MTARWLVAVVLLGCSHPAPMQVERAPQGQAGTGRTAGDAPASSGNTTTEDAARAGSGGNRAPRRPPIDGKVIERHVDGADLRFMIGLQGADDSDITREWTGVFLRDGHPIPHTEFELLRIRRHVVDARIGGHQLPSESVRLYEPDYPGSLE